MQTFGRVWSVLDEQVESGRFPGYAAAVRHAGETEIHPGGVLAVGSSVPMQPDTLFRIASLTKPIGAALTLGLVQDGVFALDDPVARWLPELASPRVLEARDAPLDRTRPAERAITIRHLLTFTAGFGITMERSPRQAAMRVAGVHPSALPPPLSPDEFVARVSEIPLAFEPGDGWLYDTGTDILGVLLARAMGQPLHELITERVMEPLGMTDTGFWATETERLATAYIPGPDGLDVLDPPDGVFARPPAFEKLSGGLVSTVTDVVRFYCAMADGGAPILTRESVAAMTTDHLTGEQRQQALPFVGPASSWGLATSVDIDASAPGTFPGRWGWTGGTGTAAYVDPGRDLVGVLLTQRAMTGPLDSFDDFAVAVAELAS
jgi:CubicO group peptidase (beta-lactamase class C family)